MELDPAQILASAETELDALVRARVELDRKIAGVRMVIQGLRQMQDTDAPTGLASEGLTDSCRAVLRSAGKPLSAQEVKERLDGRGFDWSRYSNPASALHTVLKRLATRGQAVAAESDGKLRYCWKQVRVVVAHKEDIDDPARLDELIERIKQQTAIEEDQ